MRATVVAAGSALAVGTAAVAVATTASAAPTSAHHHRTLRYGAHITQTSGLNDAGVPDGLGGHGTVHARLRSSSHPHRRWVGDVSFTLVVTSTTYPSTILQTAVVDLRGGTLAVQGVQTEAQQVGRLAVTGGTGRFRDATGTLTVSGTDLTIRLNRS